ncbi:hypothetical protein [Dyadobacter luticola]|uniref:Uncharacterized protein n=1 Tax=Dyadobacter luticola TaxID=1979387 RepID=A0A5R9L142_9BACT|nr:hypothetical protein [Dyadobacter luticola]TLV02266.1 hypothetical protein FEN17_01090 [Dyadobacter luticola]
MSKQTKNEEEEIEGSTPSPSGPHDESRHDDDSRKPAKTLKKEAINESESENMTDNKGYNETPPTVSVKKGKP